MTINQYLLNLVICADQLINTVLGGRPDETLSSRAYRMQVKRQKYWWWVASVIDALFFWQKDHCRHAYLSELNREHLPVVFRK